MSDESGPVERVRLSAEARFKQKEERKTDAEKVWVEMAASRTAELAKTDRLRALRLAKEEADREAAAVAAAAAPPKKTRAPRKVKAA